MSPYHPAPWIMKSLNFPSSNYLVWLHSPFVSTPWTDICGLVAFSFFFFLSVSVGVRTTEYSLEEIDEKEEMSVQQGEESESTDTSLRTGEVTAAFSFTEVQLETEKNDPASSALVPGTVSVDNSQSFKEEKQENMSTDGK